MKNEMETTAKKHKNEHFFKKLDSDRKKKNCEHTVLVSTLESDNEYYKRQIEHIKKQEADITDFEEKIEAFKKGFSTNYNLADKKFNKVIDEIDAAINSLNKVKEDLLGSLKNLRLTNEKAQKQLTTAEKFNALKDNKE